MAQKKKSVSQRFTKILYEQKKSEYGERLQEQQKQAEQEYLRFRIFEIGGIWKSKQKKKS